MASDRVDAETYSAFNRAVREAVRRINANKRAYLHYFIDYYKAKDPEIAKLTIDDLRESRIYVVDPAPIPADELQRTYDWMKSWGIFGRDAGSARISSMPTCSSAGTLAASTFRRNNGEDNFPRRLLARPRGAARA